MVLERIKQYIDNKGITIAAFERSVGMSNASFGKSLKSNGGIGSDKLENILKVYPDLSSEWLLRGEGEMLRQTATEADKPVPPESALLTILREKDATIERLNREIGRLEERLSTK